MINHRLNSSFLFGLRTGVSLTSVKRVAMVVALAIPFVMSTTPQGDVTIGPNAALAQDDGNGDWREHLRDRLDAARERFDEGVDRVREETDEAREEADEAREEIEEGADEVRDRVQELRDRIEELLNEDNGDA